MADAPETPECDKLSQVAEQRNAVVEFLEWAADNGHHLMHDVADTNERNPDWRFSHSKTDLAHQWLGIDDKKLDEERRKILDYHRSANG